MASIFQFDISQNTKCALKDGFCKSSHNYYDCFVPGLATTCAPLNGLLQKNTQWNWTSQHVEAVTAVKKLLTSADMLSHYDPSVSISLLSDAVQ